jgi:hypothetical protein
VPYHLLFYLKRQNDQQGQKCDKEKEKTGYFFGWGVDRKIM